MQDEMEIMLIDETMRQTPLGNDIETLSHLEIDENMEAFPQRCSNAPESTIQYAACFELNEMEFTITSDLGNGISFGLYLSE